MSQPAQLQVLLADVASLGPSAESSLLKLKVHIAKRELSAEDSRSVLESACKLAIARRDRDALQRNLSQLKPFGASLEFQAVELLLLLVQSKLADFFALLERLPSRDAHVDFVVLLEQYLTEGSYYRALGARDKSTSPLFTWLLEDLEHTVRDEVATCLEMSHSKGLSLQRCAQLLRLGDAREFAQQRGWDVDQHGHVSFPSRHHATATAKLCKQNIPTDVTIRECLNMAMELDRIV